jgi:hypothetical protein
LNRVFFAMLFKNKGGPKFERHSTRTKGSPDLSQGRYCAVKLHTFSVPLDVLLTRAPQ